MSPRHTAPGCQVTIPSPDRGPGRPRKESRACGQPLVGEFCEKHQADADRLRAKYGRAS